MAKENKLPDDVAKVFEYDGIPGIIVTKAPDRERVDLTKISLAKAEKLYADGKLPKLTKKKATGAKDSQ